MSCRDRVEKIGGGVFLDEKANLHAARRLELKRNQIELVVVERNKAIQIANMYSYIHPNPDVLYHLN